MAIAKKRNIPTEAKQSDRNSKGYAISEFSRFISPVKRDSVSGRLLRKIEAPQKQALSK